MQRLAREAVHFGNVSRLKNGLTTASIELNGAVSSLVLAYRAGARYQQPDEAGLVHTLRRNVGKDSADYLGIKLLWQLGSVGGNLRSYVTKDLFAVQLDVVRFEFLNVFSSVRQVCRFATTVRWRFRCSASLQRRH